ncbi:hypothetical protein [Paraburkholderia sp. 2C]
MFVLLASRKVVYEHYRAHGGVSMRERKARAAGVAGATPAHRACVESAANRNGAAAQNVS